MGTERDPVEHGDLHDPYLPMLPREVAPPGRRRSWLLLGAVVAIVLVAAVIAGITLGSSGKTVQHKARPSVPPAPTPPPRQAALTAQGLVAEPPDIRSAVEAVMPPEMRSALGSPRMQQSWQQWIGTPPYGERNWSYNWTLNGDTNFRLDSAGPTHARAIRSIVSTYNNEQEAVQGFQAYEKSHQFISSIRSLASCDINSDKCHYYGARPGMGDGSFDLYMSSLLSIDSFGKGYSGQLTQDGALVGARFRNVAVYVYWYGLDVPRGNYPGGTINKGTPLPYSEALPQGIAYVKAIIARL